MKFAFVSTMTSVPWGGSEMLWSESAKHLAIMGHQVYVSVPKWPKQPKPIHDLKADFGIQVWERSQKTSFLRRGLHRLFTTKESGKSFAIEKRWLKRIQPDLVCISSGNATEGLSWMEMTESLKIPYVSVAQAHVEYLWPLDEHLDKIRYLFDKAERCFFVSRGNLQLLETQVAHELRNSEIIFNPFNVNCDFEFPWPSNADGIWQIACVGRLHPPSKGQDILLKVISLEKWKKRPIKLSIFGKGPHEECLFRLTKRYGLTDIVSFQGYTGEVNNIWRDHHALILPSRYEGLPLAIVEAMICKRPVITTNVAGNAELLNDGITGFVAEAPTAFHLDKAMERAWNARDFWQDMGIKARKTILQRIPEMPSLKFAKNLESIATGID